MLIYEKNNKLNINFDNEISENPDLQIGKDGDKTEVLIDGKESSGGMLVLYPNNIDGNFVAFLDNDYQHRFESFEEALNAVKKASMVAVVTNDDFEGNYAFLFMTEVETEVGGNWLGYCINATGSSLVEVPIYLYYEGN